MPDYSSTPLIKKLGIKEGFKVKFINPPAHYFELLGNMPPLVKTTDQEENLNFVHLFTNEFSELEESVAYFKERIVDNGMIWVSWHKKASKLPTELNEDIIRGTALEQGLVDVKVCAIDERWSGLKLMIRIKDRKK